MKEFTFICISYCQADIITEHLDSIKRIVETFGKNVENDLIVADDFSKDGTADVARKWIEKNRGVFRRAEVLPTEANMGTVKNIYRAIDSCKTEHFKILAGDDKYNNKDIYSLYDSMSDEIVVTPVLPFGEFDGMDQELIKSFRRSYRLCMEYNRKNRLGELILFRSYLFAPGVFTPSKYWRDPEVRELLGNFKYIEDAPMWMKLLYDRKTRVRFDGTPYVFYRVAAKQMLGSARGSDIREIDGLVMKKIYPQRMVDKSKYLKPKYYGFLVKKTIISFSKRYDGFFAEDPEVKRIYIDMISR